MLLVLLGIPACPASKEPRGSPQLNLTTDAPVSYCFNIHEKTDVQGAFPLKTRSTFKIV